MKGPIDIKDILFDGNNLCLDFINTMHNRYAKEPIDYIVDKTSWLEWLQRKEVIKSGLASDFSLFDLQKLRQLRELLYRIFYGIISREEVLEKDLAQFNRYLLRFRKATKLSLENGLPTEKVCVDENNLNSYLLLILEQAHHLLIFKEISRIKECSNCGWLFLDTSKSKKRKWCNMKTCGNELKAKRHYQRVKNKRIRAK